MSQQNPERVLATWLQKLRFYLSDAQMAHSVIVSVLQQAVADKDGEIQGLREEVELLKKQVAELKKSRGKEKEDVEKKNAEK